MSADRWKQMYRSEYGRNIDRKHLETKLYTSSCAIVFTASTTDSTCGDRCSGSDGISADHTCGGCGGGGSEGCGSGHIRNK
jgi:hypothetical protein